MKHCCRVIFHSRQEYYTCTRKQKKNNKIKFQLCFLPTVGVVEYVNHKYYGKNLQVFVPVMKVMID